jgi:hypothetical protein
MARDMQAMRAEMMGLKEQNAVLRYEVDQLRVSRAKGNLLGQDTLDENWLCGNPLDEDMFGGTGVGANALDDGTAPDNDSFDDFLRSNDLPDDEVHANDIENRITSSEFY